VNPHLNVELRTIPRTIRAKNWEIRRAFALAHPVHSSPDGGQAHDD
jgi:hypothetical protein